MANITYRCNYEVDETNSLHIYTVKAFNEEQMEIGTFQISGKNFDTGETMGMTIFIEDDYRGRGISREMVKQLCEFIQNAYPEIRKDQLLQIDTDASWEEIEGEYISYWDHIGMTESRYYERGNGVERAGKGWEKDITFLNLSKWANATVNPKGGYKLKKKSKKNLLNKKKKLVRKKKSIRKKKENYLT